MTAARPLFRPEAVEAQRQQWLGGVQLIRPVALGWITLGVVITAVALAAFLTLGQYTRKATASGVLVPDLGLIRLVPAAAGTVIERRVAEGQAVLAGDVMFVVSVDRPLLAAAAQAQVRRSLDERRRSLAETARSQQQLVDAQRTALDRRLAALRSELAQLDSESGLLQQRLLLAEQTLARWQALQADQFISAAQTQGKAEELLALRTLAQGLARQRLALVRDQVALEGEARALPLLAQASAGALERDVALAERDSAEQDAEQRLVVRAPTSGTVGTLLAEPGQSVSPASALATLVPEGAVLQAQLYAPSSAVGFIQPGQAVRLRFEAFPYQRFGQQAAQVVTVSRTPLAASELAALALPAAATGGEPLFRITAALEGKAVAGPFVPGMRLQADVMLERRRLIEWLFEPLLGLRGRL